MMNPNNMKTMVAAGYVVSPNNIWNQPGVRMYAGGPGIMEHPEAQHCDVQVTDTGISVIRATFKDGKFTGLVTVQSFSGADEFLSWVREHGKVSEPGLPPFANSWD